MDDLLALGAALWAGAAEAGAAAAGAAAALFLLMGLLLFDLLAVFAFPALLGAALAIEMMISTCYLGLQYGISLHLK